MIKIYFRVIVPTLTTLVFINANVFAFECHDIESVYKSIKMSGARNVKYFQDITDLDKRYKVVKQFTSGRGGANVFWVKDTSEKDSNGNNIDKVVKIFKPEAFEQDFERNRELREIYFSCQLVQIDPNVFPAFYDFGYTNGDDPFYKKQADGKKHFYFVMEFIKGKDLLAHSEGGSFINDQGQVKKVLTQVVTGLKKAHEALGFFHTDLHPGNIMIIDPPSGGKDYTAKIIDFGWATSSRFYKTDGINVKEGSLSIVPEHKYRIDNLNFIRKLAGNLAAIKAATTDGKKIAEDYPFGDDNQSINMIIYGLKKRHDPPQFLLTPDEYCGGYDDCINKLR